MMKLSNSLFCVAAVVGFLGFSCTEQHDPTAHRKQIKEESKMANSTPMKLTEDGKIPAEKLADGAVAVSPVDAKYKTFCASCHGVDGDANSPVAAALNPKPRDFTDQAWQAKVSDADIAKVIKEGGAALGLSPTMAAWGAMLSDSQITDMVKKIRSYKK